MEIGIHPPSDVLRIPTVPGKSVRTDANSVSMIPDLPAGKAQSVIYCLYYKQFNGLSGYTALGKGRIRYVKR